MSFQQSVIETMGKRQSVRTYETRNLSETHLQKIEKYLTDEKPFIGPFGKQGNIQVVHVTNNVTDKGIKLGTYGFIKNPTAYIVGVSENNKYALVDFGYTFHRLVLYLTELELGTCWMGGTFNRNSFEKEISINDGHFIPCVTPIGYPKEKQRMFDKALRYVVKADNKKVWEKLFYDGSFEKPLMNDIAGELETPIEMVRIGPSASNKQPWRLVLTKDRKTCHFYIEHTPNYSTKLGYDMQLLDMGIAMCQFELACKELAINGEWEVEEPAIQIPNENIEYIVSWRRK